MHNAGIAVAGVLEDLPDAEIRRVMETNFFGVLALTRALLPTFRAQGHGRIVLVSSQAALAGQPGNSMYCASKWALEGWAESLAYEVDPFGIDVVVIEPGPYRTEIWNSRFDPWPGRPLQTIEMYWHTDRGNSHPTARDQVFVYGYQGNANQNFQVFYREQASQNIAGGYATCQDVTSRPEIDGITCPITAPCVADAPTSLVASVSGYHVSLTWSPSSAGAPAQGYIVEAGSGSGLADLAQIALGSVPALAGVAPGGRYFVRVRATTACGTSGPSNEIVVDVPSGCSPPGIPGNLQVVQNGRQVTLSWAPASGNVVSYRIDVGSGPGLSDLLVTDVGQVNSVSAVAPSGTYYVRLRAVGACGSTSGSYSTSPFTTS